jgi:hypothetical protein
LSLCETVEQYLRDHPQLATGRMERRSAPRHPFGRQITVEPFIEGWSGLSAEEMQPFTAYAKDISAQGVGFFHTRSIPTRRVVCRMRRNNGSELALLTMLRWCHAIDDQWYLSGGSFVGLVTYVAQ